MNRISIIIPSLKRRADWRALQSAWYANCGIERFYAVDDSHTAFDAMKLILHQITTPYVVCAGDDDSHVPEKLHQLARFLDKCGPDVIGVYGDGLLVQCENWKVGWTADYSIGMKIERFFSVSRTEAVKAAIAEVPPSNMMGSREVMNSQNQVFIEAMERRGIYGHIPRLQLIHCHHADRGELETTEALFKRMAEKCGGGWLASWLPSRSCSRRNLERERAAHYVEFQRFKHVVDNFAYGHLLPVEYHPV